MQGDENDDQQAELPLAAAWEVRGREKARIEN